MTGTRAVRRKRGRSLAAPAAVAIRLLTAQACDICPGDDAANFNASAALTLPQPFGFIQTCGTFEVVAQALDAAQCTVVQGMGSLCGCATRTNSSCHLCGDRESRVPAEFLSKPVDVGQEEVAALDANLGSALQVGLLPSCEMMEAYLFSVGEDDERCSSFRDLALCQCGCDVPGGDASSATPPDLTASSSVVSPCNACPDGVADAKQVVDVAAGVLGVAPGSWTCGVLEVFSASLESASNECQALTDFAYLCGCNDGVRSYLGADTRRQQAVLAWLPRASGFLSIVGSSLIVWDVSKNPQNRRSLRHQLLFGMSLGDIVVSICFCLSTLPIPKYHPTFGVYLGIYGAEGNENTCTAQGFFVQLGYISVFFNLALSTYYLLVIKYGMRESQIKRYRFFFLLPPLLAGLSLAFAGIPFYDNVAFICHVPPPYNLVGLEDIQYSKTSSWWPIVVLSILPLSISIVVGCGNMIAIYYDVRNHERRAQRWMMNDNGNNNSMSRPVLMQATLYTASFLLCWTLYYIANFRSDDLWDKYTFWVFLMLLNPLMGFCNCLVYYRAKIAKSLEKSRGCMSRWRKKKEQGLEEVPATAGTKSSHPAHDVRSGNEGGIPNIDADHQCAGAIGLSSGDDYCSARETGLSDDAYYSARETGLSDDAYFSARETGLSSYHSARATGLSENDEGLPSEDE